jgi:uncharacterized membrane protein
MWKEIKRKSAKRISALEKKDLLAYLMVFFFIFVFTILSFFHHDSLKSYLNDLGYFDQFAWNALHGDFFHATAMMLSEKNVLAVHFTPILVFFLPFYFFWTSPKCFLLLQAIAVGLSALPIYWYAKEKSKNYLFAFVFLFGYLLNPVLHNALLYDFHEVVFAVFFASFAFYYLEKGRDVLFVIFSIFLSLSQEHLPLLVFMMGLCLMFFKKRRKFGFVVSLISLSYFIFIVTYLMPQFSSNGRLGMLTEDPTYGSRYGWLGSNFPEIIKNILSNPQQVIETLLFPLRQMYLIQLITPVFSLALYSWPVLIVLPMLAINLLSSKAMMFNIYFYHSAIIIPFLYFSSIQVFYRWFFSSLFLRRIFFIFLIGASIFSAYSWGFTSPSRKYTLDYYAPSAHARKITEVKKIIPPNASLSVQNNLGPHFSQRKIIYRFPQKFEETEFVLLDTFNPYLEGQTPESDYVYATQIEIQDLDMMIKKLKTSDEFEKIYDNDGYLLFKNKSPKL